MADLKFSCLNEPGATPEPSATSFVLNPETPTDIWRMHLFSLALFLILEKSMTYFIQENPDRQKSVPSMLLFSIKQ